MLPFSLDDIEERLQNQQDNLNEIWTDLCDDITYEEEDLITIELCWKSNLIAARENLDRMGESHLGQYWQARLADAKDHLIETQDRINKILE